MTANKVLASLSYFSLFFAPFLFPLIVYLLTDGITKKHARNAFLSHIIPTIVLVIGIVVIVSFGLSGWSHAPLGMILFVGVCMLVTFILYIWNI